MAVQSVADAQGGFKVEVLPRAFVAQGGAPQRFRRGEEGGDAPRVGDDRLAGAAEGDGRADGRFRGEAGNVHPQFPPALAPLVAEKGSIAVDGVSLTVVEATPDSFTVSAIPHTLSHTTLAQTRPGDRVNLEADILARYVARLLTFAPPKGLSLESLRDAGFY